MPKIPHKGYVTLIKSLKPSLEKIKLIIETADIKNNLFLKKGLSQLSKQLTTPTIFDKQTVNIATHKKKAKV